MRRTSSIQRAHFLSWRFGQRALLPEQPLQLRHALHDRPRHRPRQDGGVLQCRLGGHRPRDGWSHCDDVGGVGQGGTYHNVAQLRRLVALYLDRLARPHSPSALNGSRHLRGLFDSRRRRESIRLRHRHSRTGRQRLDHWTAQHRPRARALGELYKGQGMQLMSRG